MKRILYLLLVSAPIFSMQPLNKEDNKRAVENSVRTLATTGTCIVAAEALSHTVPIIAPTCIPGLGFHPLLFGSAIAVHYLYNKFNEKYEIRERSSIPLNKESSSIPKRSTGE